MSRFWKLQNMLGEKRFVGEDIGTGYFEGVPRSSEATGGLPYKEGITWIIGMPMTPSKPSYGHQEETYIRL